MCAERSSVDLSRLEYLEFGSRCFGKLDRFMLMSGCARGE